MALTLKNLADELKKKLQQGVSSVGNITQKAASSGIAGPGAQYLSSPQYRQTINQNVIQPIQQGVQAGIKMVPAVNLYNQYKGERPQLSTVGNFVKGVGALTMGPTGYAIGGGLGMLLDKDRQRGMQQGISFSQQITPLSSVFSPVVGSVGSRSGQIISRIAPKSSNVLTKILPKISGGVAEQAAIGGTYGALTGQNPIKTAVEFAPYGAIGAINPQTSNAKGFTMGKQGVEELANIEDRFLNPQKYATSKGKLEAMKSMGLAKLSDKQYHEMIRDYARTEIDRLAVKYLPNQEFDKTLGNTKAIIKKLVDLSEQNKLGNFPVVGITDKKNSVTQAGLYDERTVKMAQDIYGKNTDFRVKKININDVEQSSGFDNPKNISSYDRASIDEIKEAIKKTGQIPSVVAEPYSKADKSKFKYFLTDGEHRIAALRELGYKGNVDIYEPIRQGRNYTDLSKPYSPFEGGQGKVIRENVAQQPLSDITKGVESMPQGAKKEVSPTKAGGFLPDLKVPQIKSSLSQTPQKQSIKIKQSGQALEDIIAQGRKQIGGKIDEPKVSFRQSMDNLYTQWVDRFNPIIQASQKAKQILKTKGATLRPEYDPEYLVRRLTGAGGIADNQFKTQLEPIIKQVEGAGIPKIDLDTYLANKRIAGFGKVGRDIYGADPVKAGQIVNALETKYPNIGQFADQLYSYQNRGFQEMIDAGFISPENAKIIQGQNPDYAPLKRVMDEVNDYLGLPTRKTMQGSQPIAKIKGSARQIESPLESIIGNTFSQRAAIEKNRVAKAIVGLQDIAGDMGFTKAPKSDANTITVWNNGQKEYWNVGKDIADVAKGVNEEQMNLVLKVLQAPAALLRQGATGRNPEFMIPNIIRDQLDAGITSKFGYIPFVDYVSGLKSMISNDEIYQKWANSGAKIDLGEMSGKKSIQGYFDTAAKKKGLFSWLGSGLDVMGKYSEVPTRVGLFKKAYKKTGNDLIAALESRDATVDFARMGSKMKVANSIIPFLNVGVQGFDKLIRSVKSNPAKVLFNATLYGTAPAIATTVYNLANHPKEYAEIPQYEKDSNFVIVTGRNKNGTVDYLTFPKGNVLPTITNPVQSFIDYLYGVDQQSFKEMALQTLSSTLPVIGDGQSVNEIALKTVGSNIPQLFKPAAENILNKSFYKYDPKKEQTKDIVPYYLQNELAYKQTYKFTPQMYQKIGAILNVSPLKVQNIMEGYLAGYAKIPAQIIEVATKASNNEEISPNEKTILRRFIKQTYPTSGTKKVETKPAVPSIMERLGITTKAAEVPTNIVTYTKGGKDYEVDLNKTFTYPTVDTSTALGKEAVSRYKSDISSQVNKVYDAYQSGAITEQQASDVINQLSIAYDKTKKPKISKPKKITLKVSSYKAPKIIIKKRSSFKAPKIVIRKPKKIKLAKVKVRLA